MRVCSICGTELDPNKKQLVDRSRNFVCQNCLPYADKYHLDSFSVENGEVIRKIPLQDKSIENQRSALIDYAYFIFNQKIARSAFPMIDGYIKEGKTYLGMIRTLEYFYVIKKNDIKKAKNSLGIIKYMYDEAQKYYEYFNNRNYKKFLELAKVQKVETKEISVEVREKAKKPVKQMDMSNL